jgi:hypothetical protein
MIVLGGNHLLDAVGMYQATSSAKQAQKRLARMLDSRSGLDEDQRGHSADTGMFDEKRAAAGVRNLLDNFVSHHPNCGPDGSD